MPARRRAPGPRRQPTTLAPTSVGAPMRLMSTVRRLSGHRRECNGPAGREASYARGRTGKGDRCGAWASWAAACRAAASRSSSPPRGVPVTLVDENADLLTRTAVANEGKVHLGYMYAADPSLRTARTMLAGRAGVHSRSCGGTSARTSSSRRPPRRSTSCTATASTVPTPCPATSRPCTPSSPRPRAPPGRRTSAGTSWRRCAGGARAEVERTVRPGARRRRLRQSRGGHRPASPSPPCSVGG